MLLEEERTLVVEHARRLRPDGLVIGTAGNISARREDGLVAITPTFVDYDELEPRSISVVDETGALLEGPPPSSELPMHLLVYRSCGAGAVVHTHSLYATTLSTLVAAVPPVHYLFADLGGDVRVAAYADFGTEALARSVVASLDGRSAALLANHGAITTGQTVAQAYERSLLLEWLAEVYYRACLFGEPRALALRELDAAGAGLSRNRRRRRTSAAALAGAARPVQPDLD